MTADFARLAADVFALVAAQLPDTIVTKQVAVEQGSFEKVASVAQGLMTIAILVLTIVLVPAVLMVSTIRFRSFKTIDLRSRRPYTVLLLIAAGLVLIATQPRIVLVVMAYSYLSSAFIGMAVTRFRHRGGRDRAGEPGTQPESRPHSDRAAR